MVRVEKIIAHEQELGKIGDTGLRQMATVYFRAKLFAGLCSDIKKAKEIFGTLPPVPGLLGAMFHIHLNRCLGFFSDSKEFADSCKKLANDPLGKGQVEEYALALLLPLRQSVGSCFATAFLIHVQKSHLEDLARDLYTVFAKKSLLRVLEGEEIRIPLCVKTGVLEHGGIPVASALMKSYEYTVAGLADAKVGFSRWNFRVALGLDYEAEGGLGKVIYSIVEKMVEKINSELKEFQEDIENLERGLNFDDAAFKSATSYDRMDSIKRAAKAKQMQIAAIEREIEISHSAGDKLSVLYKFFVEQYITLFPHYFQELYDPEMFSEGDVVEDRPAGFRLVYKHGRSDARVWTYITNDKEYIETLRDFITITEPILLNLQRANGLEKEVEYLVSEMLIAISRPEFLEEQKSRIASMHQKYLKEEENISPYAYIAGGNLSSLMHGYLQRENPIVQEKISAKSVWDLCYSLIEFMKDENYFPIDRWDGDPFAGMLISNNTHAFNFLPAQPVFKKSWQDGGNTYTYMRDKLFSAGEPVVFADTNWGANFLAFVPGAGKDELSLTLYDGLTVIPFSKWDGFFSEESAWDLYIY